MNQIAQQAVEAIRRRGADYGDVRVVEARQQQIEVNRGAVESINNSRSQGFGVRVLRGGAWGFHSSHVLTPDEVERVVDQACLIADATATVRRDAIRLDDLTPITGEYETPVRRNPFDVALDEKLHLLVRASEGLMGDSVRLAQSFFAAFDTVKLFASTGGSFIRQRIVECGGGIAATAIGDGQVQVRSYPNSFRGNFATAGYEFFEALDILSHVERVRREAQQLLKAPQCPGGKKTIILEGGQLALQVHESIGHPIELDRVLGMESAYAGDSFLTLDKLGKLQYGSPIVNVVADATTPGGLGTFGYDDEGVPAQSTDIIRQGQFVGYMSSRETAPVLEIGRASCMARV